jgi:hypothetical protein
MGLTQADFDRIAAQQLRLFCLLAVFLYGGYTVTHYLFLPEAYVVEMMIISAVTTGVAGVVYVFREKPFVQNNAESCVMTILAMASFNVIAHLVFTEEMKHTTSFIVLLAVVAYMLPSLKNFITLVLSVVLTWVLLVSLMPGMKGDFFHFGFAMGLGVFMAVFLNHLRRYQLTPALVHNVMSHVPAAIVVRDRLGADLYHRG